MGDLGCETKEILLIAAREQGYAVSERQLARWHRIGLLPRPTQRSLGRPRGTESIYPAGTRAQLLVLCALKKNEGRVRDLAWLLWWEGYNVELRLVRSFLQTAWLEIQSFKKDITNARTGKLNTTAYEYVIKSRRARAKTKLLRSLKKRIGRRFLWKVIKVLLEVLIGQFQGFHTEFKNETFIGEEKLLERALSVEGASTQTLGTIRPWLLRGLEKPLIEVSELMRDYFHRTDVSTISYRELEESRQELILTFDALSNIATQISKIPVANKYGLGLFTLLSDAINPNSKALLLLFWISMKRSPHAPKLAKFLSIAEPWRTLTIPEAA